MGQAGLPLTLVVSTVVKEIVKAEFDSFPLCCMMRSANRSNIVLVDHVQLFDLWMHIDM